VSSGVVEHDIDIDVHQWVYDSKDVYRGAIDPEYISHNINVHWLYDDDSTRIGLAEHETDDLAVFNVLWFHDNPYAMLFQDVSWKPTDKTLWSTMSTDAYHDCLDDDFKTVHELALNSGTLLITPELLMNKPDLYICKKCNKKSLVKSNSCSTAEVTELDFNQFSKLFIDEDFVLYSKTSLQRDACDPQERVPEQQESPPPLQQQESPQQQQESLPPHPPPQP
jgi:hypothetical protein